MKASVFVLSFLLGLMSALKHQNKLQKLIQSVQGNPERTFTCTTAIENYKKGLYDDYKTIIANKVEYKDPNFTASATSLQWPFYTNNELSKFLQNKWSRLSQINSKATLFGDNGFDHDIDQGHLGNCYFLGGIAAVAEVDERIRNVFINQQINSAGIYAFNVYIRGIPTIVTVDDYVPVSSQNQTVFALIGSDNSIWGPLLEKAWAKVNGNFERTEGGFGREPISFLTNFPARRFTFPELNGTALYNVVHDHDSNNYIMTLGINGGLSDKHRCNLNLPCSHLYTLLDVQTVRSKQDTSLTYNLYKFRNPWRSDADFTGKWNDKSPMWTANGEDFDKQVGLKDEDDGIMWMEEKEVHETFADLNIAYYQKDWKTSWYNRENDDGLTQNYTFTLEKDTFLNIKLDVYSRRMYAEKCKNITSHGDTTSVSLQVRQIDNRGNLIKTITFVRIRSMDTFGWVNQTETPLEAGRYRIQVTGFWQEGDVKDYTLSIMSKEKIPITDSNGQERETGHVNHDYEFKNIDNKKENGDSNQVKQ